MSLLSMMVSQPLSRGSVAVKSYTQNVTSVKLRKIDELPWEALGRFR
jgi:hypothetical protein